MFIRIELALSGRTKLRLPPPGCVSDLAIRPAESRAGKSAKNTHTETSGQGEGEQEGVSQREFVFIKHKG